MDTREFIKRVEAEGYSVDLSVMGNMLYIEKITEESSFYKDGWGDTVASISVDEEHKLSTRHEGYDSLTESERRYLFGLLVEYAATELEHREDKTQYFLRFKPAIAANTYKTYHLIKTSLLGDSKVQLDISSPTHIHLSPNFKFTEKEINELEGQDKQLADLCKWIEVEK